MGKLAINLDDETLAKAKEVANSRSTTLDEMVQNYVKSVAQQSVTDRERSVQSLLDSFKRLSRSIGPRTWTREDLYER